MMDILVCIRFHRFLDSNPLNKLSISEEALIDFQELIGEHSGENMAEAVWRTLKMYSIESQVSLYFIY